MRYLENYLERIKRKGNLTLADAISKTVSDVVPQYISNFSFREHVVSLLVGDVQSGKTSHMFGLMCAAADEGFVNFILLTTDNILLQQQTFKRAEADLCDFCICDENDYLKFVQNNMRKPAVIVLKKNGRILKQWKNNLSSTNFVAGNPLFIIDDEADAASLNTKVNKNAQSTINKNLEEIKKTTTSSIYMEVTGTPQSILLQTIRSGWKPYFIYYFRPGKGYLGGNFFFPPEVPPYIVLTDNDEATDILNDEEFPENGLKTALVTHLLTSAHIMLSGGSVCNFLIHPSMKTDQHTGFAEKIGEYLNEIIYSYDEEVTRGYFKSIYDGLKLTKHTKLASINTHFMEKYYKDLLKMPAVKSTKNPDGTGTITESTVNEIHKVLRSCFRQAVKWDMMEKNPAVDATVPKAKKQEREIWTAEMLMQALEACDNKMLKIAFHLAFTATLRIGELLGLTWDDMDISEEAIADNKAYVIINKQVERVSKDAIEALNSKEIIMIFPSQKKNNKTVRVLKSPKTDSSKRKVFIPKSVAQCLIDLKKDQEEIIEALGNEYQNYNLVMATTFGLPIGDSYLRTKMQDIIDELGLPDVVFHSLRHTSVTYKLKLSGGDIKAV